MTDQQRLAPGIPTLGFGKTNILSSALSYPPLWRSWYIVVILMLVTFTSLLDRYLPVIALGPIKQEFGLTDTSVSLIQGLAFSLFYCLAGVPVGWLVDHRNRRNLIIVAVAIWTGLTIWSGLANSYAQLFIARAGIGVAEAVLAPAAYSIISDSFPPHLRGRAIGFYFISLIVGSSASFILGGALLAHLAQAPLDLPGFGILLPWRGAFVILGALGIPALIIGASFREPPRHEAHSQIERGALVAFIRANASRIVPVYLTLAFMTFVSVLPAAWATTLFNRKFDMPVAQAASFVGIGLLIGGVIGCLAAGILSDRWRDHKVGGRLRVQMSALLLGAPILAIWPLMPNVWLCFILFVVCTGLMAYGMSSNGATLQAIVPNRLRGQMVAISQILLLLAAGFAPTAVALVTDGVFANPAALPWSLAVVGGIAGFAGFIVSVFAASRYMAMLRVPLNSNGSE